MKVLTVGVSPDTLHLLSSKLTVERADSCEYAEDILEFLKDDAYDALIVDLENSLLGASFTLMLRRNNVVIPIIAIGGRKDISWYEHRARFLESGGDDLVHAPGNPREILASLFSCIRRINAQEVGRMIDTVVMDDGTEVVILVDTSQSLCMVDSIPVDLTLSEFKILSTVIERKSKVVSKEALLTALYSGNDEPELKIIDVYVCKVRKKLDMHYPGLGDVIKTEWGRGYMYKPQVHTDRKRLRKIT
jgi:two-component system, cell cycle response regulator CtrA